MHRAHEGRRTRARQRAGEAVQHRIVRLPRRPRRRGERPEWQALLHRLRRAARGDRPGSGGGGGGRIDAGAGAAAAAGAGSRPRAREDARPRLQHEQVLAERVVRAHHLDAAGLHRAQLLVRLLQVAVEVGDRRQIRLLVARQRLHALREQHVKHEAQPARHFIAALALISIGALVRRQRRSLRDVHLPPSIAAEQRELQSGTERWARKGCTYIAKLDDAEVTQRADNVPRGAILLDYLDERHLLRPEERAHG